MYMYPVKFTATMFAWVRGPHKCFFFPDLSVSVSMKAHLQEIAMLTKLTRAKRSVVEE